MLQRASYLPRPEVVSRRSGVSTPLCTLVCARSQARKACLRLRPSALLTRKCLMGAAVFGWRLSGLEWARLLVAATGSVSCREACLKSCAAFAVRLLLLPCSFLHHMVRTALGCCAQPNLSQYCDALYLRCWRSVDVLCPGVPAGVRPLRVALYCFPFLAISLNSGSVTRSMFGFLFFFFFFFCL